MITITNNTGGGQPVALENLRGAAAIYRPPRHPVRDRTPVASPENAWFVKAREPGQGERGVREIAREVFDLADATLISAKKDGMVNIGGFIATRRADWLPALRSLLIL
jgi:tryptophanase